MTTSGQKRRMSATKKADALFSKIVRSRGICEMAPLFPKIKCNGNLQCAHVISRRYRAIRWNEDNALCACAAHHLYQTHHPLEFEAVLPYHDIADLDTLKWAALNDPPEKPDAALERLKEMA